MKKVYEVYDKIFNWFDEHRNKEKIKDPACGDATVWIAQRNQVSN